MKFVATDTSFSHQQIKNNYSRATMDFLAPANIMCAALFVSPFGQTAAKANWSPTSSLKKVCCHSAKGSLGKLWHFSCKEKDQNCLLQMYTLCGEQNHSSAVFVGRIPHQDSRKPL